MDIFLPKGFEPGLTRQRMSRPMHVEHLCVDAGGVFYPVLRRWATGFAVRAGDVPALSGIVDLFDGAEHLGQCLITGKDEADGEVVFRVKRACSFDYAAAAEFGDGVRNTL